MKKILLLTVTTLMGSAAGHAQTGMGIGTNTPAEKLEVVGGIKVGSTSTTNAGTIRWNGSAFQGYDGTQWLTFGVADADWTINGNDEYSAVSGNVGIGIAAPSAKLEIAGQVKITGGTPGLNKILTSDANGLGSWQLPAVDADWTISGNDIYNTNSGNVGIGTTTPDRSLNIESATGPQLLFTRDDGTTTAGEMLGEILFDSNDNAPSTVDAAAVIRGAASQDQGNSNKGAYLSFLTKNNVGSGTSATERLRIAADGNVGIGVPDPAATLDVLGTMKYVDGNQAVDKVLTSDANGNASWGTASPFSITLNLWGHSSGSGYSMTNTSGQALSNCNVGFSPTSVQSSGNVMMKVIILVTSSSGTNSFQIQSGSSYPITIADTWTWTSLGGGHYLVESQWKVWAAGITAKELRLFGWTSSGGQATFDKAYIIIKSN